MPFQSGLCAVITYMNEAEMSIHVVKLLLRKVTVVCVG
jgi:hypothetical protein